jgi:hypothetical protein
MSWQDKVFDRLRDREWHEIGPLFEEIEEQIPLHFAMRHAVREGRADRDNLPNSGAARWRYFLHCLGVIGVERADGNRAQPWKWSEKVQLRYLPGKTCPDCDGPVLKATWSSKTPTRYTCLACVPPMAAAVVIPTPAPIVIPMPKPFAEQPIGRSQNIEIRSMPDDDPPSIHLLNEGRQEYSRRRGNVRWLRPFFPAGFSVTKIEKLLRRFGDSIPKLLEFCGIPYSQYGGIVHIRKPLKDKFAELSKR